MRCIRQAALVAALAAAPIVATAQEGIVGEWNLDAAACAQSRVTYTEDGRHEALVNEDGKWKTLAAGRYTLDGDTISVEADGQSQSLEVVTVDAGKLVLRNPDPAQMEQLGVEQVVFVRCPAR